METTENFVNPLLSKVEEYTRTSIELLKLKAISKTADLASGFISRLGQLIMLLLFSITFTIALALWLGDILGKDYYGFLIMAGFYLLTGLILCAAQKGIKRRINGNLIRKMLN